MRIERIYAVAKCSPEIYRAAIVDARVRTGGQLIHCSLDLTEKDKDSNFAIPAGEPLDLQVRTRYVTKQGELVERPWQATDTHLIAVTNPVAEPATT